MEQIGNITLYNDDCMNVMKTFKDNQFDLAIIDPPYGINNSKKKGRLNRGSGKLKNSILQNSDASWDIPPKKEYFEELFRVSKNQIIWGSNYFNLPPTRGIIVWDKIQPWENFSQVELAWTSFDKPAKLFKFDNRTGDKIHPTQKPVDLYKWLLTNYANKGDTILDTHFGSLSIGIACYNLGFELTAIELDEEYYNAGKERLVNHMKQLKLFE